jgi:hypothetical protein
MQAGVDSIVSRTISWHNDRRMRRNETPVGKMRRLIEEHKERHGTTWKEAASAVASRHPGLADHVMEQIGSWPSSETALRALQDVW